MKELNSGLFLKAAKQLKSVFKRTSKPSEQIIAKVAVD
jgi:hypothetical protein